jgi:hypothetical protein
MAWMGGSVQVSLAYVCVCCYAPRAKSSQPAWELATGFQEMQLFFPLLSCFQHVWGISLLQFAVQVVLKKAGPKVFSTLSGERNFGKNKIEKILDG